MESVESKKCFQIKASSFLVRTCKTAGFGMLIDGSL